MADDYRQRLTDALVSARIRLTPDPITTTIVQANSSFHLKREEVLPLVGAVLVARDQELAELRRETKRLGLRAEEAEGVIAGMRELLHEAARLCTSCDRWHKHECWRLCPIDGTQAEKVNRYGYVSEVQRLVVVYQCGHSFTSHLPGADEHHARLRAHHA